MTQVTYSLTPEVRRGDDDAMSARPLLINQLIEPTRVELEQARDQCLEDAKRFRFWRWWLVGMFTFYTTLAGILLLKLLGL